MKTIWKLILLAWCVAYCLTSCSLTTKDGTTFTLSPDAIRAVEILAEK